MRSAAVTEILGMETAEMADTPPTAPRKLITYHIYIYGVMFRFVRLEHLPVIQASLARREKMLLQVVAAVRSCSYI